MFSVAIRSAAFVRFALFPRPGSGGAWGGAGSQAGAEAGGPDELDAPRACCVCVVSCVGACCGQPATAQSESLRVEHHPQPTLTRTASLSLGDTPTRPLTLARNGGGAEQAYGGRETPKRVPTGVPLGSLEGTQG